MEKPGVIPDTGSKEDQTTGPTGPRIRCPLCGWTPPADEVWSCRCGHRWNTFDTGGVCPSCLYQWLSTQCPSCKGWSAHSAWYEY